MIIEASGTVKGAVAEFAVMAGASFFTFQGVGAVLGKVDSQKMDSQIAGS